MEPERGSSFDLSNGVECVHVFRDTLAGLFLLCHYFRDTWILYKGPPINYVTRISWFFTPPPSLSQVVTFLRPPYLVWRHIFTILHLEIIKLKQQKCDVTKFRIPPPLVTLCHTSSTPSASLNVWRNLWMPPLWIPTNFLMSIYYIMSTALVKGSPCLTSNQEVVYLIPSTSTTLKWD